MRRCLELAANGIGTTKPNPSVGAVIVLNDSIIGEGYTSPYGGNHAEVNAIHSVKDLSSLRKATLYVTLEPCVHFGKTPPCTDLIIRHQIPNIVIGCLDTNELVAGKGIEKLKQAGCNVLAGVLENECKAHHSRFFTFHTKKHPYIILKWAETKNGFIAPLHKDIQKPVWITNTYSRQLVHKLRAKEHAILVGTNTVLADNPKLNVRDWEGINPIRIVLDKQLKLPGALQVFDQSVRTIVITDMVNETNSSKSTFLEYSYINFSGDVPRQICEALYGKDIQSVLIEGGAKTLRSFIEADFWNTVYVFVGDITFKEGIKAPVFSGNLVSEEHIGNDVLRIYKND
ncbi:MAG: bifunctional diaminohydroxyphosphoribosylaminopyrimidine deaminase/5-amino-6-(5-phosphoribosylamino)uracil reductase RibD [Flavobacteriaceae bacterium]|nr:MAG: bifunctional diaminohydroxyphosphoribosylaminopyrimidine deaminase/5-amino-6-(5-phosphoribosylamino)uracil reductase RibD [Flavobacteriaceae bacterium]